MQGTQAIYNGSSHLPLHPARIVAPRMQVTEVNTTEWFKLDHSIRLFSTNLVDHKLEIMSAAADRFLGLQIHRRILCSRGMCATYVHKITHCNSRHSRVRDVPHPHVRLVDDKHELVHLILQRFLIFKHIYITKFDEPLQQDWRADLIPNSRLQVLDCQRNRFYLCDDASIHFQDGDLVVRVAMHLLNIITSLHELCHSKATPADLCATELQH
mmetsp:Transcript_71931/g.134487  ORF Transcript_71931/g.134487 Transcript_71931/m.134487 type:complete len:213 (-) Transcript_71931:27-665(-)